MLPDCVNFLKASGSIYKDKETDSHEGLSFLQFNDLLAQPVSAAKTTHLDALLAKPLPQLRCSLKAANDTWLDDKSSNGISGKL